jgi:hypothetical protein
MRLPPLQEATRACMWKSKLSTQALVAVYTCFGGCPLIGCLPAVSMYKRQLCRER